MDYTQSKCVNMYMYMYIRGSIPIPKALVPVYRLYYSQYTLHVLQLELETSVPDKLQKNPEVSKSSNTRNNKKRKKGKGGGGGGKQQVNKKKKGGKQAVPVRETVKENTHVSFNMYKYNICHVTIQ